MHSFSGDRKRTLFLVLDGQKGNWLTLFGEIPLVDDDEEPHAFFIALLICFGVVVETEEKIVVSAEDSENKELLHVDGSGDKYSFRSLFFPLRMLLATDRSFILYHTGSTGSESEERRLGGFSCSGSAIELLHIDEEEDPNLPKLSFPVLTSVLVLS